MLAFSFLAFIVQGKEKERLEYIFVPVSTGKGRPRAPQPTCLLGPDLVSGNNNLLCGAPCFTHWVETWHSEEPDL